MADTYKVQWGDTLSELAKRFNISSNRLVSLNSIEDPDLIYEGQTLKLTGTATSSSSSSSDRATITAFGIQSNNSGTIFATWSWGMHSETEHYETEWYYTTGNKNAFGNIIWFTGSKSTTEDKVSTYSIPSNAKQVRFRVKPISKTETTGTFIKKEKVLFDAEWTSWRTHTTPPPTPPTPTVKLTDRLIKVELTGIDLGWYNALTSTEKKSARVQFQIVKNGNTFYVNSANITINATYDYVSWQTTLDYGNEYKVRCRYFVSGVSGKWSSYSSSVATAPIAPAGFTTCEASKRASDNTYYVYLKWNAVSNVTSYDIEYTTDETYFDNPTGETTSVTVEKQTELEVYGLGTGVTYYFRLRAKNDSGVSEWSTDTSIVFGEPPAAPTTWSSTTTATVGGPLNLYWVHNAKDGSSQTYADLEIELYVDGELYDKISEVIENTDDVDEKDKTSSYPVDTSSYTEGVQMRWRVRTAGVTNEVGDWSTVRIIDVYAEPTLQLTITDINGNSYENGTEIEALESFPIRIQGLASPSTQAPIGYYLTIISNEAYETVDNTGNVKMVNSGDQVYSKYFDISTSLDVELSAMDVDLENTVSYTVVCTVAMNSGLTAEAKVGMSVAWTDVAYVPNASLVFDPESVTMQINPYCTYSETMFYEATLDAETGVYTVTDTIVELTEGYPVENGTELVYAESGDQVFEGTTVDGATVYYCTIDETRLVEGIILSVYRREFDGTFTEIGTGIDNMSNTHVTDPHPSLDYARYRIIAMAESTGAISYYDMPGYPVEETSIILQWDEDWTTFDITDDADIAQPNWSGSLLRLPYNIDVSDSYDVDVELVEYIGRKRPVAYHGTQLGESSTWSAEIPADDKETVYAIRRLSIWTGNVYVREPSGSGYWAVVKVSFNQTHCEVTIPVTLTITRVDGGM